MKNNFLFAILCVFGSFSITAQSSYFNHGQDDFLRVEFNRIFFDDLGADQNFLSFNAYLNGEFKVGKKNKISFELPYSRFSIDDGGGGEFSVASIGNIAVGYQIRDLDSPNYFEFKVRVPTVSEDDLSPLLILSSDYTERFSAFFPDLLSLETSYNLESNNTTGLYYRFRPGLKLLIPTSDELFNNEVELLLDLNILGGYRTSKFDVNAGLTTTSIITDSDIDLDDRVLRQLFTSFTYMGGALKPGVILRMPMGELNESINYSIGVHLTYTFGSNPEQVIDNTETN